MSVSRFVETLFGCVAITLASIMALGASYSVGLTFGELAYVVLVLCLLGFSTSCSRSASHGVWPGVFGGISALTTTTILTAFNSKMQHVFFGFDSELIATVPTFWAMFVLTVLPVSVLAGVLPYVMRRYLHGSSNS